MYSTVSLFLQFHLSLLSDGYRESPHESAINKLSRKHDDDEWQEMMPVVFLKLKVSN